MMRDLLDGCLILILLGVLAVIWVPAIAVALR